MDTLARFKIKKTELFIVLNEEAAFDEVLVELVEKLQDVKKLFKKDKINIFFSGRELSSEEEDAIYTAIEEAGLNLVVYGEDVYIEENAPELKFSEEAVLEKAKNLDEEVDPQKQPTFFQNGSLRSGRRIDFAGSVVLLGDLNAGAEIVAQGNIIILGACRGMVHAGAMGDSNAYIFAQQLTPTQIRISEMVTYLDTAKNDVHVPSYAYIDENKIYVAKI